MGQQSQEEAALCDAASSAASQATKRRGPRVRGVVRFYGRRKAGGNTRRCRSMSC